MKERLDDAPRAIRVGKQLPARFLVQRDSQIRKEPYGLGNGKGAQDPADDRRAAAPEVGFRHDDVRHIAASAAAHEDLGARPARRFEEDDARERPCAVREDRRRESGGAGADDREVRLISVSHWSSLRRTIMPAYTSACLPSFSTRSLVNYAVQ